MTTDDVSQREGGRPWLGVILSVFVAGSGLVRAGRWIRGLAWFAGFQLAGVFVALLLIARWAPAWVVAGGMLLVLVCWFVMLVDSYRPGRMSWPRAAWFVVAVVFLAFVPPAGQLVAGAFKVPTDAMAPTLLGITGGGPDYVVVDRISYKFSAPKRGDLVVFRTGGIAGIPDYNNQESIYVKRLAGLPGEKIEIREGKVYADGKLLDERSGIPAITYTAPTRYAMSADGGFKVPPDGYFVLGDNSANSFDSRYWGAVPRANIFAKVARIYYPWARVSVPK